jgi:peptidoglycan-N-acetylglucosamine deacetylase
LRTSSLHALFILLFAFIGSAHAEKLALTFDDLPLNGELPPNTTRTEIVKRVLAILNDNHVPPVYGFINAQKLENNRDGANALKLWIAGSQHVGNHTYSHTDLHKQSPEIFVADLREDEPALELLDGTESWHWFRYPYLREGDTLDKRHAVRAELKTRGYRTAQVTLDYEDYLWNTAFAHCVAASDTKSMAWLRSSYLDMASKYIDGDREMANLVFGRKIDHVLLLHLGAFSSTILPDLLALLHDKGFTLVTLEEAQRDAAYDSDPDAASKYGGTLLEQWMDARQLAYPDLPKKPYKQLEAICK